MAYGHFRVAEGEIVQIAVRRPEEIVDAGNERTRNAVAGAAVERGADPVLNRAVRGLRAGGARAGVPRAERGIGCRGARLAGDRAGLADVRTSVRARQTRRAAGSGERHAVAGNSASDGRVGADSRKDRTLRGVVAGDG